MMTLIIGYRGVYKTILMADDRITYHGDKDEFFDGHTKLIELPDMGWTVASGLTSFIDTVKQKIADSTIRSVEDMINLYSDTLLISKAINPNYSKDIESSEIIVSWFGTENETKGLAFHAGILNKSKFNYDNGIAVLEKNRIYIGYPYGFPDELINITEEKFKYYKDDGNLVNTLKYLLNIFYFISSRSNYANTHVDIGIHTLDYDNSGNLAVNKIKISGESKELLEDPNILKRCEFVRSISSS